MNEADEREYFQYLELKRRREAPAPRAPASTGPSEVESGLRGAAQGLTLGYADEVTGALESAISDKTYQQARDESRAAYRASEEENPGTYLAGNVAGGLATEAGLAALTGGASLTPAAQAALGAAAGLGSSEADLTKGEFGRAALDAAGGAAVGAVAGKLGQKVGQGLEHIGNKIAGRAAKGVKGALGEIDTAARATAAKAEASAQGAYRSAVQSASRDLEVMAREADNLPEGALKDSLRNFLNSEEGLAVRESVASNKLRSAPERVEEVGRAREAFEELVGNREANVAEEVRKATDLGETWRTQVKPRIATLGHRFIPPAVGTAIGGPAGAAVGMGASLIQGRPGTIVANAVKSPRVRYAGWKAIEAIARSRPEALGKYSTTLSGALSRGDRSFAVAHRLLADRDPNYRELIAQLEKEQAEGGGGQ